MGFNETHRRDTVFADKGSALITSQGGGAKNIDCRVDIEHYHLHLNLTINVQGKADPQVIAAEVVGQVRALLPDTSRDDG